MILDQGVFSKVVSIDDPMNRWVDVTFYGLGHRLLSLRVYSEQLRHAKSEADVEQILIEMASEQASRN